MVGCFIPKCKSGHGGKKAHMFRPPNNVKPQWTNVLNKLRADKVFDPSNRRHLVCHLHFTDEHIIKTWDHNINGRTVKIDRKNWTLKPGTTPTIFPGIPRYLHPTPEKVRRPLLRIHPRKSEKANNPSDFPDNDITLESGQNATPEAGFATTVSNLYSGLTDKQWVLHQDGEKWSIVILGFEDDDIGISKSITFKQYEVVKISIGVKDVTTRIFEKCNPKIESTADLLQITKELETLHLCEGLCGYTHLNFNLTTGIVRKNKLYSKLCEQITTRKICTACLRFNLTMRSRPQKRKMQIPAVKHKTSSTDNSISRFKKRVQALKTTNSLLRKNVNLLQKKMKDVNFTGCVTFVNNLDLHPNQKDVILQTLKTMRVKSSSGNRYTSGWLLECLLLRIKSPAAYTHLREAKMLPLPHLSTLQRLIAHERCQFGFSASALEAIRSEFRNLSRRDRQGTLIFDEVKLRESLDYNKQTHYIEGFVNFGDQNADLIENEKDKFANHALVMMYRPLNANWVQPIAAFATRDAAKGTVLAKLVLQAVVKLESIGAEVINVVCDGAKPNRKMWKCFGISGKAENVVNKIQHPYDDNRILYFSSDVPHLFKCIRNHFLKYEDVNFQGELARFSHYEKLYYQENTLAPGLRLCPKLTSSHISPNNFEKMVVPFATQLFSKHVGDGLTFYKDEGISCFEDSCGTILLTYALNSAFDALNAKIPAQGLKPGCPSFQVLETFHSIVIAEQVRRKEDKSYVPFASDETLEGLSVTIASTLEIIKFLVTDLQFYYVLTVKFNQDALEKFFGLIRAAGGREEHPTIKNFLHLYRLLSMYNPCKRILRGNIRDTSGANDETVLCQFRTNLKKSAAAITAQHRKVDDEIKNEILRNMDSTDLGKDLLYLSDHNYTIPATQGFLQSDWNNETGTLNKKIVFHLCGYLAYKFRKLSYCEQCVKTLYVADSSQSNLEYATLTDLLNKGPLHYPSLALFNLIVFAVEPSICKIIDTSSFFGDMLMDCIKGMPSLSASELGCPMQGHREDLFAQLIPFYVNMRFNFWCRTQKDKIGKGKRTRAKRKESKLV